METLKMKTCGLEYLQFSKEKAGVGTLLLSQKTYIGVNVKYSLMFSSFKQVRDKM